MCKTTISPPQSHAALNMGTFNIMTGHFWILILMCVAGYHLSSSSPAALSPLVVHTGQNVSLTCNFTSSSEIIWYLLRSDQLLPLLRVSQSKIGRSKDAGNFYTVNASRFTWVINGKLLSLEILSVEEEDAGLYFCTSSCEAHVCVNSFHLKVNGTEGDSAREKVWQPCWSLGICILPALLSLCFCVMTGFYFCSGKLPGCCCKPLIQGSCFRVTEEEPLHYSSLRHPDKPRPPGREASGLVEELVTYSTVTTRKNTNGRNHK